MYTFPCYPPMKKTCLTHFAMIRFAGIHTLSEECCMHRTSLFSILRAALITHLGSWMHRGFSAAQCSWSAFHGGTLSKGIPKNWSPLWRYCCILLKICTLKILANCLKQYQTLLKRCFTPSNGIAHCNSAAPTLSWKNIGIIETRHTTLSNKHMFIIVYTTIHPSIMHPLNKFIVKCCAISEECSTIFFQGMLYLWKALSK